MKETDLKVSYAISSYTIFYTAICAILTLAGFIVSTLMYANSNILLLLSFFSMIVTISLTITLGTCPARIIPTIVACLFSSITFFANLEYLSFNPAVWALLIVPCLQIVCIVLLASDDIISVTDKRVIQTCFFGHIEKSISNSEINYIEIGLFNTIKVRTSSGGLFLVNVAELHAILETIKDRRYLQTEPLNTDREEVQKPKNNATEHSETLTISKDKNPLDHELDEKVKYDKAKYTQTEDFVIVQCPHCGEKLTYSKKVFQTESPLHCPFCQKEFKLQ